MKRTKTIALTPPDEIDPLDHAELRALMAEHERDVAVANAAVANANRSAEIVKAKLAELEKRYGTGQIDMATRKIKRSAAPSPTEPAKPDVME